MLLYAGFATPGAMEDYRNIKIPYTYGKVIPIMYTSTTIYKSQMLQLNCIHTSHDYPAETKVAHEAAHEAKFRQQGPR
jgi:hypothetical protein